MKDVKRVSEEILYSTSSIVSLSAADITTLKAQAKQNLRKRVRICTHLTPEDALHDMLIVHMKDCYVRPHRHLVRAESFHIVEGDADVVLFENEGQIKDIISLSIPSSGKAFYYRLSAPYFHTLLIRSEFLVFHESTSGPFNREGTEFAPWAPEEENETAVKTYISELENACAIFKQKSL